MIYGPNISAAGSIFISISVYICSQESPSVCSHCSCRTTHRTINRCHSMRPGERQFPKTTRCRLLASLMAPLDGQDMGQVYYFKIGKCAITLTWPRTRTYQKIDVRTDGSVGGRKLPAHKIALKARKYKLKLR